VDAFKFSHVDIRTQRIGGSRAHVVACVVSEQAKEFWQQACVFRQKEQVNRGNLHLWVAIIQGDAPDLLKEHQVVALGYIAQVFEQGAPALERDLVPDCEELRTFVRFQVREGIQQAGRERLFDVQQRLNDFDDGVFFLHSCSVLRLNDWIDKVLHRDEDH